MKKFKFNKLSAVGIFFSRFVKIAPNMSLLGSYGFFSSNLLGFFLSFFLYDLLAGGFYKGFLFTYLGFFSYYLLGKMAGNNLKKQFTFLPLASFMFFLISNFGVWLFWYERTFNDLLRCYLLAVPFYKFTLFGDLLFGYGYLMIKNKLWNKIFIKNTVKKAIMISNN